MFVSLSNDSNRSNNKLLNSDLWRALNERTHIPDDIRPVNGEEKEEIRYEQVETAVGL